MEWLSFLLFELDQSIDIQNINRSDGFNRVSSFLDKSCSIKRYHFRVNV
jgi:hypothetical protein